MSELEAITGGVEAPTSAAPQTASGGVLVAPTAPYMVGIRERDPPGHGVSVKLGPDIPQPTGGGGGYEEQPMPKRGAVAVWKGRGLMRMSFSVRFDRSEEGASVEGDYSTLLRMWRPEKDTTPPPVVKVSASGDTIPYQTLDWTIEDLEWADAQGDEGGQRTEQVLVVKLQEFRPDRKLKTASSKKGHTKTIEVKNPKKETLGSIAAHYHVKGGAKALGKAQHPPIKDPRHLHKGQKIVVPLP